MHHPSTSRRWVAYRRVSTTEQGNSALGLEAQHAAITAAFAPGDVIVADLVDVASGKTLDRDGLNGAFAMLANGEADGLIVSRLDRLSRRLADVVAIAEWFDDAGADLRALDLGIDTTSTTGRLILHVMASFAEWERQRIGERTSEALRAKVARGERWIPAVADRDVADRIRELRAEGLTYRAICAVLNETGVPTVRGGAKWYPSALQTVLSGPQPPRRPRSPGCCPPCRAGAV